MPLAQHDSIEGTIQAASSSAVYALNNANKDPDKTSWDTILHNFVYSFKAISNDPKYFDEYKDKVLAVMRDSLDAVIDEGILVHTANHKGDASYGERFDIARGAAHSYLEKFVDDNASLMRWQPVVKSGTILTYAYSAVVAPLTAILIFTRTGEVMSTALLGSSAMAVPLFYGVFSTSFMEKQGDRLRETLYHEMLKAYNS
jgi:hypothetical protein